MAVFGYSYFVTGSCRDAGESYTWYPENNIMCRYFLRGNCMYGTRCRFAHSETGETSGPSAAGPSELPVPSVLQDQSEQESHALGQASPLEESCPLDPQDMTGLLNDTAAWANAPEFIPSKDHSYGGPKSYAQAVHAEAGSSNMHDDVEVPFEMPLCPLMEKNASCGYGANCAYIHGDICEICGHASLHPTNAEQRVKHQAECVMQNERKMELSEAMSRSVDKSCGICMEVIMEKNVREQRFGILPNCNHCFCLKCIRKWRQAKQFENKIIRACPECRVTSDFVCPSMYWVSTKEEKETLIKDYKQALSVKNCKYFNIGQGKCPFGNKCFYLHAYPDGTKADVGPPVRQRRQNSEGDYGVLQQIILWDFLDERDNRWMFSNIDDLEDLVAILSEDSDSDWSEYDAFFD